MFGLEQAIAQIQAECGLRCAIGRKNRLHAPWKVDDYWHI